MATAGDDEITDSEAAESATAARGGRRMVVMIAGGVLLLLGAAGGGAYSFGMLDGLMGKSEAVDQTADASPAAVVPTYYEIPEILVSLNTGERRSTFLKVKVSLELANPADQSRIERLLPRIIDYCQVYLRELRLEEIRGSAGMTRLREELLRRIGAAIAPTPINDLLFNEIFVQ